MTSPILHKGRQGWRYRSRGEADVFVGGAMRNVSDIRELERKWAHQEASRIPGQLLVKS